VGNTNLTKKGWNQVLVTDDICRVDLVNKLLENLNVMKRQRQFHQYQQDEQVPLTSSHWTHDKESTTHTDGNSGLDLEMTQSSGGDNFLAFDPYISTIKYLLYTCVHGHRMHWKRMGMRCWSYRNLSTRYSRTCMSVTVYLKKYIFMKK
jgi:hypothetical protein